MKDQEEYEDYLVDKAKELLNSQIDSEPIKEDKKQPEMRKKRNKMDEKVEEESTSKIPFSWDPREIEHLTKNRRKMDNEDLKEFFEKDSEFQNEMKQIDEWKGFSRWEERFMVQHPDRDPEEIAEELGRETKQVRLKMHMLGIKVNTESN